jgi:DNA-binding transcriptional ArsR family regulator
MPRPRQGADLVFAAVSNPYRRKILDALKAGERPAGDLVALFPGLPQPAVSRHLRVLRQAGLVEVYPKAQQRVYSLRPQKLREVDRWVSLYRGFWAGRLESLAAHLVETGGAGSRKGVKQ